MDGFCSIQENGMQHKKTFTVNNNNTAYLCIYLFEVSVLFCTFFLTMVL